MNVGYKRSSLRIFTTNACKVAHRFRFTSCVCTYIYPLNVRRRNPATRNVISRDLSIVLGYAIVSERERERASSSCTSLSSRRFFRTVHARRYARAFASGAPHTRGGVFDSTLPRRDEGNSFSAGGKYDKNVRRRISSSRAVREFLLL